MVDRARPRKSVDDSLVEPAAGTKRAFTFESPDWLVELAVENARKANMPLDFLNTQLNALVTDDASVHPVKKRKESLGKDHDMVDQEKRTRKQESSISSCNLKEYPGSLFAPKTKELPSWYTKIKTTDRGMKQLGKSPSSDQNQANKALSSMKGCMERCEKKTLANQVANTPAQLEKLFEELRDHVHKAEVLLKVDKFILRKAKILEEDTGLPRIFTSAKADYPWDLKVDAYQLYLRWHEGIFEIDLLRGITVHKGKDRAADRIAESWKGKYSAKFYGEGNLVPGQWWPTQLTTFRDGAHGSPQGGIYGEKEKGAYSVVLSGGTYDDEDNGVEIWYSGTDGRLYMPTENTNRLIESHKLQNEIRVLRSHQLPKNNPYRPVVGLRYDGCYKVHNMKLIDPEKQKYKFKLVRCEGQFPIRCEDNAARRPTRFEIDEDDRLRKSGRFNG
jgi:hypothetical protein